MVSKNDIEKRIYAYRFALYDLALFLDSHPCDQQALHLRQIYMNKLDQLIDAYEQCYGKFILTKKDVQDSWMEWVSDPWPWDITRGDGHCVAV